MLDAFQLASADVTEFQTKEEYSILDLTGVKYNVYIFTLYFSKIHFNIIFHLHGEFDTFTPYVSKTHFNIIFHL
jgi:hypothetical protein